MIELLLSPLLLLAAFLAALGTIFCAMKLIQIIRSKEGFLPYMFYTATFVNMLQIIIADRNLFVYTDLADYHEMDYPGYFLAIARTNSGFILLAAFLRIAQRLTAYGSKPAAPTVLIGAFLFFFITNVVTAAFLGTYPSFEHYYIYLVLVGTASLFFTPGEESVSIRAARNAFFVFLLISAAFIPSKPEAVIDNNYLGGLIPGFTYRYSGLASHPNHLGQITTLFMMCLWSKPYASRWLNFFAWVIGYASLVFAQSKTSWVSFIICMACMAYYKHGYYLKRRIFNINDPFVPALFIFTVMVTVSVMLGIIMFSDIDNKISLFLSSRTGADLTSMTGRTQIWDAAVKEWRSSPLFGYGLTIWDEVHRRRIGLPMAFHAHNQFYQSLSSAGLLGVIGLIIYVVTLLRFTMKTARSSQGLTLAILLMLVFQSISEVPLAISGHFEFNALTHLLLLMIIAAQCKSYQSKKVSSSFIAPQKLVYSRGLN
jgi:exopolysaccharide production protein ExoQ